MTLTSNAGKPWGLKAWMWPPWVAEVIHFLVVGSGNSWYGLVCPAHCSASITLLCCVFLAGFSSGALSGLLVVWFYHLRPVLAPDPPPVFRRPPGLRLAAYLHERAPTSG